MRNLSAVHLLNLYFSSELKPTSEPLTSSIPFRWQQENPLIPEYSNTLNRCQQLGFGIVVFIFFVFFYDHHLHFIEQLQLFILTGTYFLEKLVLPGGFNGWIGGFLTQFYFVPIAGAMIIALLLTGVQLLTNSVLRPFSHRGNIYPLNFIPAIVSGFILCSELYPLSAITGFTIALAAAVFYTGIRNGKNRFAWGIILIAGTWYLAGGAYISLILIMNAYELITLKHPVTEQPVTLHTALKQPVSGLPEAHSTDWLKIWQCLIYLFLAVCIPLFVRQFAIFQPVKQTFFSEFYHKIPDKIPLIIPVLFTLPVLLILISYLIPEKLLRNRFYAVLRILIGLAIGYYGFVKWVDFDAEEIMTYDYLAKNQRWDEVISFAEKKLPQNFLSLAVLNLSLAKKGQLGDKMFKYGQHGSGGLFLGFDKEFITPMMGNEIFYHLGLINASQEYAFESMEVMPDMEKSVRAIKRLAETNLINGNYKVAEKYLKIVAKTLFHRQWAVKTRKILYNEEMINKHPDYGEKRKLMVKEDFFFHVEDIESVLHRLLKENPENITALEYLAAYYLLNREMEAFVNLLPVMEKMTYRELPVSWQEAFILYKLVTNIDPLAGSFYKISPDVRSRMESYAKVYLSTPDARKLLSQFYSATYWYYFHYTE